MTWMSSKRPRLAALSSHPIQYYGPLYRELAGHVHLTVLYAHKATPSDQAQAGFGTAFEWDVDITSGYRHEYLANVAAQPGLDRFGGCDTPAIGARLDQEKFDALLVMGWHLKSFVQGILAAKRRGIPVLVRGDSQLATPRPGLKRILKAVAYPVLLRALDAALYVGSRSREYYRHYGYPEDRLFHSPHAVDTRWFAARATTEMRLRCRQEIGVPPDTPLVLFAGKLVPFKRPNDVVEAVAQLRKRGARVEVLIAGDGELRSSLVDRARELGVPAHLLGFCNQSRMPAVYAACDALVLPSDGRETWGLVANEALACGRPVILSEACGSAPDLVGDGQAGLTFPTGRIEALADAIEQILARPPSTEVVLERSQRHSLEAAARGVVRAIDRVAFRRKLSQ